MRWLGKGVDEPILDVEMAAHYARSINGDIHVLVPGKLLLCPTPQPLSSDQAWADVSEQGRPPARLFSAAFLAELLSDLDVSAVACLGHAGAAEERLILPDVQAFCASEFGAVPAALDAEFAAVALRAPGCRHRSSGGHRSPIAGEPVVAYRETFTERAWRWARRHRKLIGRAAAVS